MKASVVRFIQQQLAGEGKSPGEVDGKLGRATSEAIRKALFQRQAEIPVGWQEWPDSRKAVAYLQVCCAERGIEVGDIDGYWGPQTDYACESLHVQ